MPHTARLNDPDNETIYHVMCMCFQWEMLRNVIF